MTKKRKRTIKRKKLRRECWNLDLAFIKWLYPRLKQYLRDADRYIDLTYHKITVDGLERDQLYWIKEIILLCELSISSQNVDKSNMIRVGHIWAELLPYMWW